MKIINSNSDKDKEIKLIPEMLNLLGCSKENFKKLIKIMGYKVKEKDSEVFFKYVINKKFKKTINKKTARENPFGILKDLNLN